METPVVSVPTGCGAMSLWLLLGDSLAPPACALRQTDARRVGLPCWFVRAYNRMVTFPHRLQSESNCYTSFSNRDYRNVRFLSFL